MFKILEQELGLPTFISKSLVMLMVVLIAFSQMILVVDEGEEYSKVLFGEVSTESVTKGFHVVNPLASFHKISLRQEEHVITGLALPAQDKLKSTVDLSIVYQFQDGIAPYIYSEHGSQSAFIRKQLLKKAEEIVRETGKTVTRSEDFFTEATQNEMKDYIKSNLVAFFDPLGMTIVDVRIVDIDLPAVVRNQIVNTKERAEKVNQQEQQLEIVTFQAEEKVREAQAAEQAAKADANAIRTLADAEAYKIETTASAQAAANTKLSRSVTPVLADYIRANSWDGKYPQYMLGDNMNMFMSMPSK